MIDGGSDESSGGSYLDYSQSVIDYLRSIGVNDTNLEFYLGSHPHTDHIANADVIINTFKPDRVYISEYLERYHTDGKRHTITWKAYSDLITATQNTGAILIQNLNPSAPVIPAEPTSTPTTHDYSKDEKPVSDYTSITDHNRIYGYQDPHTTGNPVFQFGDTTIEIFNYSDFYKFTTSPDVNDWSWGVKVTADGHSAFLSGDINNFYGSEDYLSSVVGHVDLLKLGHHGHKGSNSYNYLKALSPKKTIATGSYTFSQLQPDTKQALEELGASYVSSKQGKDKGQSANIAVFTPNGIILENSGIVPKVSAVISPSSMALNFPNGKQTLNIISNVYNECSYAVAPRVVAKSGNVTIGTVVSVQENDNEYKTWSVDITAKNVGVDTIEVVFPADSENQVPAMTESVKCSVVVKEEPLIEPLPEPSPEISVDGGNPGVSVSGGKVTIGTSPSPENGKTTVIVSLIPDLNKKVDSLLVLVDGTISSYLPSANRNVQFDVDNESKVEIIPVFRQTKSSPGMFEDVGTDSWYTEDVYTAYDNGYLGGYGNTGIGQSPILFGPSDNLTRAQAAVVFFNMACGNYQLNGRNNAGILLWEDVFSDVDDSIGNVYRNAVVWANKNGLVTGYSGTTKYGPSDNITREQVCLIFERYAKTFKINGITSETLSEAEINETLGQFPDGDKVSGHAREAVAWAAKNNYIGRAGFLAGTSAITRAEFAAITCRIQPVPLSIVSYPTIENAVS